MDSTDAPAVTYCHPEVASVGLTEEAASGKGPTIAHAVHPHRTLPDAVPEALLAAIRCAIQI